MDWKLIGKIPDELKDGRPVELYRPPPGPGFGVWATVVIARWWGHQWVWPNCPMDIYNEQDFAVVVDKGYVYEGRHTFTYYRELPPPPEDEAR